MSAIPRVAVLAAGVFAAGILCAAAAQQPGTRVDFDRDVRPILSENCFACHGFDAAQRKAGLRLDTPDGPFQKAASGRPAVVRGNPAASTLIQRVTAQGGLKMPPEHSGKTLTPGQIQTLKTWIAQGAPYKQHWSFLPIQRPPVPRPQSTAKTRNPIDAFIVSRLEREGLKQSPEADRYTLIRRLSFDLTGLPPTPDEVQRFVSDPSDRAYENLVDRLLASPHYGERMAVPWLDLARYADTHGYHIDSHRDMWPWRDWVIEAFNRDLPFDQFILWQLAGDLLPNATLEQKIATGFNRNHPINFEGGAIPEEYQAAYVHDRVDTTATAFMALTLRCGQCHDHKYEPFTQNEYYRFFAFFNTIAEEGLDGQKGNAKPFIKAPKPEQTGRLAEFDRRIDELNREIAAKIVAAAPRRADWERTAGADLAADPAESEGLLARYPLDEPEAKEFADSTKRHPAARPTAAASAPGKIGAALKLDGAGYVELGDIARFDRSDPFSAGAWINPADGGHMAVISRMDDASGVRGWDLYVAEGRAYVHLIHKWEENAIRVNTRDGIPANAWTHLLFTYDGSGKAKGISVYINGKPAALDVTHDSLSGTIVADKPVLIGRRNPGAPFKGLIDEVRLYAHALAPQEIQQLVARDSIRGILALEPEKRTPAQQEALAQYHLEQTDEAFRGLTAELSTLKTKRAELDSVIPTVMVMEEMAKPRETHILIRGEYDKKGEKVAPGVPAILPPLPEGMPANRLALAKWLVAPSHPLTARVAVNRIWQQIFGTGLVKTAENFGIQGERPSHPELLDWLASEFVQPSSAAAADAKGPGAWSVKRLVRLIVTSATYRQSSVHNPRAALKDPENRLLARAPRLRLTAEQLRDQALAVSGLLVPEIGGPSVRPYQPPGLWEEISFKGEFSAQYYVQDHGKNLYRRSMYTFWKRTCPPPALQTFDAPEREFCVVRRSTTNTPLQALALMNDVTFVEASRKFAERILTEAPDTDNRRLAFAFRCVLARPPKPEELRVLAEILDHQRGRFRRDGAAAMKLIAVGESPRNEKLDPAELAAWTTVASAILNLDETITKG